MKVFVTGVGGQLGHDVMNELASRGIEGVGSDLAPAYSGVQDDSAVTKMEYHSLDITSREQVEKILSKVAPDVIVHCAAWTAVDAAEEEENKDKVFAVNVTGTENIAKAAEQLGAKMVYLSTDYVFDGQGETPWDADCQEYQPLNYYGETKLLGEKMVSQVLEKYFIVRIAWVFGVNGNNFIKTMLRVGENHERLTVVNDQIGTPTYTLDLARLLVDMLQTEKYGYYHATNEGGYISWYDFAVEIFKQATKRGRECYDSKHLSVAPVTTEEYGISKAARPFNSRLNKEKLVEMGFAPLPDWKDALTRYVDILFQEDTK